MIAPMLVSKLSDAGVIIYTERSIIWVIATNKRCVEATYAKSIAANLVSGLLYLKNLFKFIEKNKQH